MASRAVLLLRKYLVRILVTHVSVGLSVLVVLIGFVLSAFSFLAASGIASPVGIWVAVGASAAAAVIAVGFPRGIRRGAFFRHFFSPPAALQNA